eukprot:1161402-Pelagomonas_calceolata.AAC.4
MYTPVTPITHRGFNGLLPAPSSKQFGRRQRKWVGVCEWWAEAALLTGPCKLSHTDTDALIRRLPTLLHAQGNMLSEQTLHPNGSLLMRL